MPIPHAIGLLFFAVTGAFCVKVLSFGLCHGVIRPRYFYGPLLRREITPFDYWYDAFHWALYAIVSFGSIFFYFYDPTYL